MFDDFGVAAAHGVADLFGDATEDRGFEAELVGVVERAADQAAEDVAPSLVAGDRAVGDQEGHGAAVLGDDAHGATLLIGRGGVFERATFADVVEQGGEEVGVVEVGFALEHHGPAFEAGAGVDALGGQVFAAAVVEARPLHEDEVPDFEPFLGGLGGAGVVAVAGPHVVVQLRAGSAGAGGTRGPEVALVLAVAVDLRVGQADFLPLVVGEVVVGEDGGDEQLGSIPRTSVTSSQAQAWASVLK